MASKNTSDADGPDSLGVLDDSASLDTTGIGILGTTEQVNVAMPHDEDDDLVDDEVVDGELPSDLHIDEAPIPAVPTIGRIQDGGADIVIEIPAEPEKSADVADKRAQEEPKSSEPVEEPVIAELVDEPVAAEAEDASQVAADASDTAEVIIDLPPEEAPVTSKPENVAPAKAATPAKISTPAKDVAQDKAPAAVKSAAQKRPVKKTTDAPKSAVFTPEPEPAPAPEPVPAPAPAPVTKKPVVAEPPRKQETPVVAASVTSDSGKRTDAAASAPAEKVKSPTVSADQENTPKTPDTAIVPRSAGARPEVALTSKRLGDQLGQSTRESADLLTADRLLDPHRQTKPEPEGAWSHFLYAASGRRINIGDGRRARERKALSAKIAAPLAGGARFVPVLSRKGGVGKTTITALLGMALADARDDRIIAVDANPDRGTLAERIVRSNNKSVRDLVRIRDDVKGYHDISAIVARDATRLDVLASDSDPRIADAFNDSDYRDVAGVAAHYYSLVLTDTGTGIVHSVMGATLDLSDQLIIVSGLSVDEARLASETLTWLETNGYAEQSRNAIIVLNQSTPGSPLVRLNELEAHFATRAKHVLRMPYDAQIAGGGAIVFANLQSETRQAARELAAVLVEGLRARAA